MSTGWNFVGRIDHRRNFYWTKCCRMKVRGLSVPGQNVAARNVSIPSTRLVIGNCFFKSQTYQKFVSQYLLRDWALSAAQSYSPITLYIFFKGTHGCSLMHLQRNRFLKDASPFGVYENQMLSWVLRPVFRLAF